MGWFRSFLFVCVVCVLCVFGLFRVELETNGTLLLCGVLCLMGISGRVWIFFIVLSSCYMPCCGAWCAVSCPAPYFGCCGLD